MGAFISRQPNGLYCRFSSVTDCPTHWNMTKEDYMCWRMRKLLDEINAIWVDDIQPFELVTDCFIPNNMSEEEFASILKEMDAPLYMAKYKTKEW